MTGRKWKTCARFEEVNKSVSLVRGFKTREILVHWAKTKWFVRCRLIPIPIPLPSHFSSVVVVIMSRWIGPDLFTMGILKIKYEKLGSHTTRTRPLIMGSRASISPNHAANYLQRKIVMQPSRKWNRVKFLPTKSIPRYTQIDITICRVRMTII